MPFPYDDRFWTAVVDLFAEHRQADDRIVAPDIFWQVLPRIEPYGSTWTGPERDADQEAGWNADWVVVHKGMVADIEPRLLSHVRAEFDPVLANEVFVVFARSGRMARLGDDPHARALDDLALQVDPRPPSAGPGAGVLADGPIVDFGSLTVSELRSTMNEFFAAGGYEYPTERDAVYDREIDRHLGEFLAAEAGGRVVELAGGDGRACRFVPPGTRYVLTDLADVALERCGVTPPPPRVVMDAAAGAFASASVDAVVFNDSFEHVPDPFGALDEAGRMLRPGGRLFVTVTNMDSLHQRLVRALGAPTRRFNNQHIVELSHTELVAELEHRGFEIVDGHGVMLAPYWEVPGVAEAVHPVIDVDEDFNEVLRRLGELVGPEHAFVSVVIARRV